MQRQIVMINTCEDGRQITLEREMIDDNRINNRNSDHDTWIENYLKRINERSLIIEAQLSKL